jgi:hypothetical protein
MIVDADDAQLACMKRVPGRTLEDAVVSTNSNFGLVPDSSSYEFCYTLSTKFV